MMIDKRLIHLAPEGRGDIFKILLCQLAILLCNLSAMGVLAFFIDEMRKTALTFGTSLWGVAWLVFSILWRIFFHVQMGKCVFRAGGHIKQRLRQDLYQKVLKWGMAYEKHTSQAKLLQLFGEGIEQIEIYFNRYVPQLLYSLIASMLLFIILLFIAPWSAIVLLICTPLIPLAIIFSNKLAKKIFGRYWKKYTGLGDGFLENLQGMTTLKIYQADAIAQETMRRQAESFRIATMNVLKMQLNSITIMDLIAYSGGALGIVVALYQSMAGRLSLGQAFFVVLVSAEFFIPLRVLGSYFHIAMNGKTAINEVWGILEGEEEGRAEEELEKLDAVFMKDVTFAYGSKAVLKGVSLNLRRGSMIAVVGESGSGKSTLAHLLMGYQLGYQGEILFDEHHLNTLSSKALVKQIKYIGSESYIFKGTVRENMRLASWEASDEEMIQALKKVQIWDFFQKNQGLDTVLLEGGSNFSGGQKQRLALARALMNDAGIYIFDEATSSIDEKSEEAIMACIEELSLKKIVFLITHRLKNTQKAHRIFVLEEGAFKEEGSYQELMDQGGIYSKLYRAQEDLERYAQRRQMI